MARAGSEQEKDQALVRGVALLRGINVGGKNRLPMQDLREMFVEAGCTDGHTYIQSGNVVFRASPSVFAKLSSRIASRIVERFGYQTPVVLRTAEQLRDVVLHNPFLAAGADEETLHVVFLADQPGAERVARLDPGRSPPDAFVVRGREVYLQLPHGVAHSKLTNDYFDSTLATTSTARNWRTVTRLLDLLQS